MIKILIFILLALVINPKVAKAADLTVVCSASGCSQSGTLFNSSDGMWFPGKLGTKSVEIKNQAGEILQLGLEAKRTSFGSELEKAVGISLLDSGLIWAGRMADFYQSGLINLGDLGIGETKNLELRIGMEAGAGNEFQNTETVFDLDFNFNSKPAVENPDGGIYLNEVYADAPSSNAWVEIYNSNTFPVKLSSWKIRSDDGEEASFSFTAISGGGFGVVEVSNSFLRNSHDTVYLIDDQENIRDSFSYVGSSKDWSWSKQSGDGWCPALISKAIINETCMQATPTIIPAINPVGSVAGISSDGVDGCGDSKPAGTPINLRAVPGVNSVMLSWDEAQGPLTYYLIAFGENSNADSYGNPNIGGIGTKNYTINQLSANSSYYFKVRAGNGCAPGDFSEIVAATPLGVVLTENETLPEGFSEEVLGEDTEKINEQKTSLELKETVLGTQQDCQKNHYPVLFLAALVINLLNIVVFRQKANVIMMTLVSTTGFILDYRIAAGGCCDLKWCLWYPLGSILGLVGPMMLNPWKKA